MGKRMVYGSTCKWSFMVINLQDKRSLNFEKLKFKTKIIGSVMDTPNPHLNLSTPCHSWLVLHLGGTHGSWAKNTTWALSDWLGFEGKHHLLFPWDFPLTSPSSSPNFTLSFWVLSKSSSLTAYSIWSYNQLPKLKCISIVWFETFCLCSSSKT